MMCFDRSRTLQHPLTPLLNTQLSWASLTSCATGAVGEQLLEESARYTHAHNITYGTQGLPVVVVNGQVVRTHQPIPLECGPTPKEVLAAVCAALPAPVPSACGAL